MNRRFWCASAGALVLSLHVAAQAPADSFFPFVLPWNDAKKGTATDISFLNPGPAGFNGRIIARNGHFVEEKTGRRVRFFGTNVAAKAAFPEMADAPMIAARMAKLGINLVRFHHLNNGWGPGSNVWKSDRVFTEMDPAQLQKLDYFIAALKKNGIYSNINLQTAREYVPEMGFPESVRTLKNFAKKVDKFNERMIVLQQQYAKDLIGRKNPYTGLRYADDPAIMKVEINNENSLVGWPGESPGSGLTGLPEPFRGELVAKWNAWLKAKYESDAKLSEAWPTKDERGAAITSPATKWSWEDQGKAGVDFAVLDGTGAGGQTSTLVAKVPAYSGPAWHIQAHVGGLDLVNGETYSVEFRARASQKMTIGVDSRLDKADWRFLGLGGSIEVGPAWKDYVLTWKAQDTEPNHARLGFTLGGQVGTLEVAGLSIRKGQKTVGLLPGESLERGTVELPSAGVSPQFLDYSRFLAETEAAYSRRMRAYLRNDLGFRKTNVIDSQISWGGLTSLGREAGMDFADNHEYWNHPVFLGKDWDAQNYRVERRALVDEADKNFGTLGSLAVWRIVGRPYSVSEYNHPAPSDFQVEMMPLYATFAAFQDWDVIYTFAWDPTGTGVKNDQYDNYFDMGRNPAKSAFFPLAALIFRQGLVAPAGPEAFLKAGPLSYLETMTPTGGWSIAGKKPSPLTQRLGVLATENSAFGVQSKPGAVQSEIKWQAGNGGKVVTVDSAAAKSVVGFVGSKVVSLNGLHVKFASFGQQFAAFLAGSLDSKPLAKSSRVLVTLGARFENKGMGWNAERNSVSDQWGTGPVQAEFVPATITLLVDGPRTVYALDPTGARKGKVPSQVVKGALTFATLKTSKTVWYEIVK